MGQHIRSILFRNGGGWTPGARHFRGPPFLMVGSNDDRGPVVVESSRVYLTNGDALYDAENQNSGDHVGLESWERLDNLAVRKSGCSPSHTLHDLQGALRGKHGVEHDAMHLNCALFV